MHQPLDDSLVPAMKRTLIIGANGQIARVVTRLLLNRLDVEIHLFLRDARRLAVLADHPRIRLIEGDATDRDALDRAMQGMETVYANLSGDMERQARAIVDAMREAGVGRLVFTSSMGIYGEAAGQSSGTVLDPYRRSAEVVEGSGLDYTVVRPARLNDDNEIAYGTTRRNEPFLNPDAYVSRKSVADLVIRALLDGTGSRDSLGVHRA